MGRELGLTVAFVALVAAVVVTRFLFLFPVCVTFEGFFVFEVADDFRVVFVAARAMTVAALVSGDALEWMSRLYCRRARRCSCSWNKSRANISRTIRLTSSSSQILGKSFDVSLSSSKLTTPLTPLLSIRSEEEVEKIKNWIKSTNFTHIFTNHKIFLLLLFLLLFEIIIIIMNFLLSF
jgi:hypothetical protein